MKFRRSRYTKNLEIKKQFFFNVDLGFSKVDRYHIANIKKSLIAFRN